MKKHKHKSKHYHIGTAPTPHDVHQFLRALSRKVKEYGIEHFHKHRGQAERITVHYLKKYGIVGSCVESYWKVKGLCVLIGKEPTYL